jgi:hypothetical protein
MHFHVEAWKEGKYLQKYVKFLDLMYRTACYFVLEHHSNFHEMNGFML